MAVVVTGGAKRVTVIRKARGESTSRTVTATSDGGADDVRARVAALDGTKFVVIDASGRTRRGAVVEDLDEPKKQNKTLRPIEKQFRKALRRQVRALNVYLSLHDRSNRKKKNGWLRDLGTNLNKARRKPAWE